MGSETIGAAGAASPLGCVEPVLAAACDAWWLVYERTLGGAGSLDRALFEHVFGRELAAVCQVPASRYEFALEGSTREFARLSVPLVEVLQISSLAEEALSWVLGPAMTAEVSQALSSLEAARARVLGRVWRQPQEAAWGARVALRGLGPLGGFEPAPSGIGGLVGESSAMVAVRAAASAVARTSGALLVTGEVGTGKELLSRILHDVRGWGEYATVDCRRITPARAEREIFARLAGGHASGAAPGPPPPATLLLSDVMELSPDFQSRLFTTAKRAGPVGQTGGVSQPLIVLTSREPLDEALADGRFDRRLARLLRDSWIAMPALRDRPEDIPALTQHFLGSFCSRRSGCLWGLDEEAMRALQGWDWPGNVAELRDVVKAAVATGSRDVIGCAELPSAITGANTSGEATPPQVLTLAESERRIVQETLTRFGGNKSRTAKALGISRHKLYSLLEPSAEPPGT